MVCRHVPEIPEGRKSSAVEQTVNKSRPSCQCGIKTVLRQFLSQQNQPRIFGQTSVQRERNSYTSPHNCYSNTCFVIYKFTQLPEAHRERRHVGRE